MKRIPLLVLCAFLVGCATTAGYNAMMDSWLGADINDFIDDNGYPKNSFTAPNGNKVYVWSTGASGTTPTIVQPGQTYYYPDGMGGFQGYQTPSTVIGGYPYSYGCDTFLETDDSGKIVKWRGQGNACKAKAP
jgi:hypothetical protein